VREVILMNPMRLGVFAAAVLAGLAIDFAASAAEPAAAAAETTAAKPATPAATPTPKADAAKAAEPKTAEPTTTQAKTTQPKSTETATSAAAPGKPGDEDTDPLPKKANASPADKAASPQRFTPSEQVRADFDVSFPIDI
jgi:hypothetical protein